MQEITIGTNEAGQRLDKFLAKYMKLAPKSFFYKMMRKKNITLNGKKCEGGEMLAEGDTVKLFLADDQICAYCRDYFSMDLIGGEESFEMFSHYEDSIYRYIYDLSGEKAQWDKVEIDTADPADIPGLKGYVSVKELGSRPYLYLKTLNYSDRDRPLVYANEYFNTGIIQFNLIRQKNIQY